MNDRVAEVLKPAALSGEDLLSRRLLEREHAEQLRRVFEILGRELHPAPPSVSGTAAALYASTGTSIAMASTSGTQNPSCSLKEMYTLEAR